MSNEAGFLDTRCREHDLRERPDFLEICRELRYIKALLLTVGNQQLNAGRLSGLDARSHNIGVVVSDPQCRIASPLLTAGCHVIFPTITNAVY
ncbi:unnamed protein product [Sphagnum jensenii]